MAEDQGGRAGMPDPFAHFQMWFNEELEKREFAVFINFYEG